MKNDKVIPRMSQQEILFLRLAGHVARAIGGKVLPLLPAPQKRRIRWSQAQDPNDFSSSMREIKVLEEKNG